MESMKKSGSSVPVGSLSPASAQTNWGMEHWMEHLKMISIGPNASATRISHFSRPRAPHTQISVQCPLSLVGVHLERVLNNEVLPEPGILISHG